MHAVQIVTISLQTTLTAEDATYSALLILIVLEENVSATQIFLSADLHV